MYIYNVTINIEESVHEQWINWMQKKHIPDMLRTGKFSKAKMTKVVINEEMGGITYSVQYTCDNKDVLDQYFKENADELRKEGSQLFAGKYVAFRTELDVVFELSAFTN